MYTDWVNTKRGDPYPVITREGDMIEAITDRASYALKNESEANASVRRLLGQHFPYANYEMKLNALNGEVGFSFVCRADGRSEYTEETAPTADITAEGCEETGYRLICRVWINGCAVKEEKTEIFAGIAEGTLISVSCRGEEFDVFADNGAKPVLLHTFLVTEFCRIRTETNFTACAATVYAALPKQNGRAEISSVSWYLDSGVTQADIRPIRYTDGTPMTEGGRLFFTMSSRLVKGGYQSVISWNPTGCDFKLEGAMFFDAGDGVWCADVASSVLYDKTTEQYLIWMCSFSHDHILAHGISKADVRYGINVIDVELMPVEKRLAPSEAKDGTDPGGVPSKGRPVLSDDRLFMGKSGDEDPDFYYDQAKGCWYLTVCRNSSDSGKYEYFRFKSSHPFEGYKFIDKTGNIEETGGSTVKIADKRYFFCGAHFNKRAVYNMYGINSETECFEFLGNIKCDYDDGGFRGWGTVVPIKCGNRTKYVWLTFDRHLGSPIFNWSYGNLYAYEADLQNR